MARLGRSDRGPHRRHHPVLRAQARASRGELRSLRSAARLFGLGMFLVLDAFFQTSWLAALERLGPGSARDQRRAQTQRRIGRARVRARAAAALAQGRSQGVHGRDAATHGTGRARRAPGAGRRARPRPEAPVPSTVPASDTGRERRQLEGADLTWPCSTCARSRSASAACKRSATCRLDVEVGHVTGLIGPNGAGKTTLFNIVTGPARARTRARSSSTVATSRGASPTSGRASGSAARSSGSRRSARLTARENVLVAAEMRRGWSHDRKRSPAVVTDEILDRVGLQDVADERVDRLPTGTARLVELGRALATQPRVLLLDEPSAGLNESETATLGRCCARSPAPASRCCSSSTTCRSSWGRASGSTCSTSAGSSRSGRRRRCRPTTPFARRTSARPRSGAARRPRPRSQ